MRPHRLSVRTALFQGAERGSTPLGAVQGEQALGRTKETGAVAQLVRVPVCHTGGRGFEPRQPRWNAECRMQNAECRMQNEEVRIRNSALAILHSAFGRPGGEIGRHAILRGWCRKASRFESAPGHGNNSEKRIATSRITFGLVLDSLIGRHSLLRPPA